MDTQMTNKRFLDWLGSVLQTLKMIPAGSTVYSIDPYGPHWIIGYGQAGIPARASYVVDLMSLESKLRAKNMPDVADMWSEGLKEWNELNRAS
jgi:hypothetical protein